MAVSFLKGPEQAQPPQVGDLNRACRLRNDSAACDAHCRPPHPHEAPGELAAIHGQCRRPPHPHEAPGELAA
eukprot:10423695-Prorocentrum_lima.AAC.1